MHAERLADIVLEKPEEEVLYETSIEKLSPQIELINLGFRYSDSEPWVIRNLNLLISPGDALALVGPSGCGKTTLIKLMLGLLVPSEGEIRYGGVAIRLLGLNKYRQAISAVMQNDQLLSGSLSDNISFFDTKVDQERIELCAKLAAIHDDIIEMPMGYQTLTGDMGTTLSGGQNQRVLLARALYKSPRVLVLDEATSHLDVERERQVNEAISKLTITRVSIAHRPETIAMATRVVRLANGVIEQDLVQGTPKNISG
jgi:ATP-binding cassette subfamily B protein RaxB